MREDDLSALTLIDGLPDTIHHYTSMAGAAGIVETQEFWLTHAEDTNDVREYKAGRSIVVDHLLQEKYFSNAIFRDGILPYIRERIESKSIASVFIGCFSKEEDSSDRWATYGSDHTGASLSFSSQNLAVSCVAYGDQGPASSQVFLQRVLYDEAALRRKLNQILGIYIPVLEKHWRETQRRQSNHDLAWKLFTYQLIAFAGRIQQTAALYKDKGWAGESEVRLVSTVLSELRNIDDRRFGVRRTFERQMNGERVRFLKAYPTIMRTDISGWTTPLPNPPKLALPLKKVTVGSVAQEMDVNNLKLLVEGRAEVAVPVEQSSIGYRRRKNL